MAQASLIVPQGKQMTIRRIASVTVLWISASCGSAQAAAPSRQLQQALAEFAAGRYTLAAPIFTRLAALGDSIAETALGEMYDSGLGVPQNTNRAYALLTQAAAQNNAQAEDDLGNDARDNGNGPQAVKWFTAAADQGVADAQWQLGNMEVFGAEGIKTNQRQGVIWLRSAAAQQNSNAENDLGLAYRYGWGVTPDYDQAMALFHQAAAAGNPHADSNIGSMYQFGEGVPIDYQQAIYWFKQSDKPDCACGDNNLGYMYSNGIGVPQDDAQAFKWYMKSAEKGDDGGAEAVGKMYFYGQGVPQDYANAVRWLQPAALAGYARAQRLMGDAYYFGEGEAKNPGLAAVYWAQSASHGDVEAIVSLGYLYETGNGVPQNYQKDFELALIAKSLIHGPDIIMVGTPDEDSRLSDAHISADLPHLTQAQVEAARARAAAWLQRYHAAYDPELNSINAPTPPSIWRWYDALPVILLLYGVAKFLQRRRQG